MKNRKIKVLSSEEMKKETINTPASVSGGCALDRECYGGSGNGSGSRVYCSGVTCISKNVDYCKGKERLHILDEVRCTTVDDKIQGQKCNYSFLIASGWKLCSDVDSGSGSGSGTYAKSPDEACAGSGAFYQMPCEWMDQTSFEIYSGTCGPSVSTANRLTCIKK